MTVLQPWRTSLSAPLDKEEAEEVLKDVEVEEVRLRDFETPRLKRRDRLAPWPCGEALQTLSVGGAHSLTLSRVPESESITKLFRARKYALILCTSSSKMAALMPVFVRPLFIVSRFLRIFSPGMSPSRPLVDFSCSSCL